jgi:hypothetical protein
MPGMGKHTKEEAMKTRARYSAWSVFIGMAGTTMSFQVYHSVKYGHMPSTLAYLYGIVPLALSMLVIEFVSSWENAPRWARPSAYLITGGSMFLSAAATGAVVFRAAPDHASLLFGLLLDGAAILAARFLMTGAQKAADTGEAALRAELAAASAARQQAEMDRDTARAEAGEVSARVAALEAKLEAALKGNTGKPEPRKPRDRRRAGETDEQKLGTEAAALAILAEEPDIEGSELGRRCGTTPGYGRTLKRRLAPAAPGGGS